MVGPSDTLGSPWPLLAMSLCEEVVLHSSLQDDRQDGRGQSPPTVRNFPCQTLKNSKVSLVVMGS
jgi:hypothetical protein